MTPKYKLGDIIKTPKGRIGEIMEIDGDWDYAIFWHKHPTCQGTTDFYSIPMVDQKSDLASPDWVKLIEDEENAKKQAPKTLEQALIDAFPDGTKILEPGALQAPKERHKCRCEMRTIMMYGCQCGGV